MLRSFVPWAAVIGVAACGPPNEAESPTSSPPLPSAAPVTHTSSAPSPGAVARRDYGQPPPLTEAELEEQFEALRKQVTSTSVPEKPAVGDPGPVVVDLDRRKPFKTNLDLILGLFVRSPPAGQVGRLAESHARLLARQPSMKLDAKGKGTVSFETVRSVPAASVYYGTFLPEDPFGFGRHRKRSSKLKSVGNRHGIEVDPQKLMKGKYDIAGTLKSGRGELSWRLEVLDPEDSTSRVYDGRTAYRCDPAPCSASAKLIQVPSMRLGPFVDQVKKRSAIVSFDTDAATAGFVVARTEGGKARVFASKTPGVRHEITLDGLEAGTRYRYYAIGIDRRGEVGASRGATLETVPEDDQAGFRFLVLSDSRSGVGAADERYAGTNRRVLRGLLSEGMRHDPGLVMFVGDLCDGYTTSAPAFRFELEAWKKSVGPYAAHVPFYEVMGNHEALLDYWETGWGIARGGKESAEAIFTEEFVNPTNGPRAKREGAPPYGETVFSFTRGNTHFAAINSNYWFRSHPDRKDHPAADKGYREGWVDDTTIAWLDADLAAARKRGARHLFVFTHEPGFPNGGHPQDAMWWNGKIPEVVEQRAKLFQVLGKHGVAGIFHGDEHNYSRTLVDAGQVPGMAKPLWQFITGGAGAPYYAQDTNLPWTKNVRAFDARQHLVLVEIEGDRAQARAVSLSGETIDEVDLNQH